MSLDYIPNDNPAGDSLAPLGIKVIREIKDGR